MNNKLDMKTASVAQGNIEKIRQLFPDAVTEVDKDGKTELAIDFDVLKQELCESLIDEGKERYQMTWPGKRQAIVLANTSTTDTLRPCKEESVDFDNTQNLYIEGDNLNVLKLLRETYLGKIKMIYIDPPYNTGNDSFIYNDCYSMNEDEFLKAGGYYDEDGNRVIDVKENKESNGRFHTDWLNMLYPRLRLARDLLTDDGVIFISIDDNEQANLKKICDEIFGETNFVATIPWQSRASMQNDTDFSVNHEYIYVYAKIRRQENRRLKESNYSSWIAHDSFVISPLPLESEKFSNPDNDPRGKWKADPFDAPGVRVNLSYEIINPKTGEIFLPPKGRHWRMEESLYKKNLNDNRIIFGSNGTGRPQLKVFYNEKKDFGSVDNSWFSADRIGTTTSGTKEVMGLLDGEAVFDMPKPVSLIKKLLYLSRMESNDILLDFFSGSATSAHAVMQLNAEDGGNRKFIMVQLPEKCDEKSEAYKAGYKNICEIGKERIRRAGTKIVEERAHLLSAVKSGAFEKGKPFAQFTNSESAKAAQAEIRKTLDIGFRVLKLDSSNMQDVYYNPAAVSQTLLDATIDNIKPDRTPLDLLFQVMLELGVPLSAKIEENAVNGKTYYAVNGNDIIACFDDDINEEVITAIAKQQPLYVVFKDQSFASDSVAINNEQLFKTYSPATEIKVI